MKKEEFLKAEEIARNLAETLARLKAEVDLFKVASGNLADARKSLEKIVSLLEGVRRDNLRVIENFLGMKGPEILRKLENSEKDMRAVQSKLDDLDKLFRDNAQRLEELAARLDSVEKENRLFAKKTASLIFVLLAISGLTLVFAILALFL